LLQRGVAVAGIAVGESYGSAAGARLFDALYDHLVGARGFAPRAALIGRSRGGLMTLAWGADRPERVAAFAGIYPVCDLRSYPGLAKAAPAHGPDEAGLLAALPRHNPIDRLERLARAGVPFFCVHGDVDTLVPLAANSQELLARVRAAGGRAELELLVGRGHDMDPGFFRSERMLAFLLQALGRGDAANQERASRKATPPHACLRVRALAAELPRIHVGSWGRRLPPGREAARRTGASP
jgi:pimeloyl-ACP methyl ester carboxylesterase